MKIEYQLTKSYGKLLHSKARILPFERSGEHRTKLLAGVTHRKTKDMIAHARRNVRGVVDLQRTKAKTKIKTNIKTNIKT